MATHWELWIRAQKLKSFKFLAGFHCAAWSIKALSILLVNISISVSSVALQIAPRPVIIVPQCNQPLVQNHRHHEFPTPVIIDRLLPLLHGYDAHATLMLFTGFSQCFPLYFKGVSLSFCSKHLLLALQHPHIVSAKLVQEVKAGRIVCPFDTPPFKKFGGLHWMSFPKNLRVSFDLFMICHFPRELQ